MVQVSLCGLFFLSASSDELANGGRSITEKHDGRRKLSRHVENEILQKENGFDVVLVDGQ